MWLYLPPNPLSPPSSCVPASACLAKVPELHSSYLDGGLTPFATWRGKPLPLRSLQGLWKREPSLHVLSGLTCSPLTAQRGVDAWISSLQASLAKTSASPVNAPDLTAHARGCFSTSLTLPTLAVRVESFWKTSMPSLLPPPPLWTRPKASCKNAPQPESWGNWPTEGGTRNGSLFQRPPWEPATSASVGFASHGGAWATPDCNTSTYSNGLMGPNLRQQTAMWPTPNAHDGRGQVADLSSTQGGNLSRDAALWPTPASRDYKGANSAKHVTEAGTGAKHMDQLPNFVQHRFLHQVHSINDGRALSPTTRTLSRRLNPVFTCWLMGWPTWWTNRALTDCAKPAMESYRSRLRLQLQRLCDGQGG